MEGVTEVLKSVPVAPGMTQDYCCTQQYLKYGKKGTRKYVIAVQNR